MVEHFRLPGERPFTKTDRGRVTVLLGGLSVRHDELVGAVSEGLGYKVKRLATATKADLQTGRRYCSVGMCNPAYFTIGALVNHLEWLRDEQGIAADRILDDYVFVTAGSCGPCRFGMYESEYRQALRASGFDGFRVLLFQEKGGLRQSEEEAGLALNAEFAVALITALMIADLLNDLACQIRPYEVVAGSTDRVFERVLEHMREALRNQAVVVRSPGLAAKLLARLLPGATRRGCQRIVQQVFGNYFVEHLAECAKLINEGVEVDFTRSKPLCKITGEAWAHTTEGDGNYRMFAFLESQGAEVIVEPMMTWVQYLMESWSLKLADEYGIEDGPQTNSLRHLGARIKARRQRFLVQGAGWLLNREYERMRAALGGMPRPLASQVELRRLARPFYNPRLSGGEGHLEVAKTVYYSTRGLCHMALSLKPFGCLPSTQSDGVQPAVQAHYARQGHDILFLSVETSGEGDINAYSRVQMVLGEAKTRCKQEFDACVESAGYSVDAVRRFCSEHDALRRPLQAISWRQGVTGRAACFVLEVARFMTRIRN